MTWFTMVTQDDSVLNDDYSDYNDNDNDGIGNDDNDDNAIGNDDNDDNAIGDDDNDDDNDDNGIGNDDSKFTNIAGRLCAGHLPPPLPTFTLASRPQ